MHSVLSTLKTEVDETEFVPRTITGACAGGGGATPELAEKDKIVYLEITV